MISSRGKSKFSLEFNVEALKSPTPRVSSFFFYFHFNRVDLVGMALVLVLHTLWFQLLNMSIHLT